MAAVDSGVTPIRNAFENPPTKSLRLPPLVNAREYPYSTQITATNDTIIKTCVRTEAIFLERTRPP